MAKVAPRELASLPADASVLALEVGAETYFVIQWPEARAANAAPARLTPAESEVLALLLSDCTNADIAARRGVATRTIANQVQAIYRKLGVSSRRELDRRGDSPPPPLKKSPRGRGVRRT